MVVTTLRIDRAKFTRFREIAASEHRTASQEMRALIDARICEYEEKDAA